MHFHLSAYQCFLADWLCIAEPLQAFPLQALAGIHQLLLVQEVPMNVLDTLAPGPRALSEKQQQQPPRPAQAPKVFLLAFFRFLSKQKFSV